MAVVALNCYGLPVPAGQQGVVLPGGGSIPILPAVPLRPASLPGLGDAIGDAGDDLGLVGMLGGLLGLGGNGGSNGGGGGGFQMKKLIIGK